MKTDSTRPGNNLHNKGPMIFWILFAGAFAALVIIKLYLFITTFFQ